MEKCKFCQADLAENSTVCPSCGKDNAEPAVQETAVPAENVEVKPAAAPAAAAKKYSPSTIALIVAGIVLVIAVFVSAANSGKTKVENTSGDATAPTVSATDAVPVGTIPADGNPDDETCKGSYTASDADAIAAANVVVATAGDKQLTNSQLQIYYWMEVQNFLSQYGAYASYFGLDVAQPLDTQVCGVAEGGTWQQFFLASALQTWQNYQTMAAEADAAGYQPSAELQNVLNNLEKSMEDAAVANGYENGAAMLADNAGNAATMEDYAHFLDLYYRGYDYYSAAVAKFMPTQDEIEAYYNEHEAAYIESGMSKDEVFVDARHILVVPQGGTTAEDGTVTYSDAEWAACEAEAQAILDAWKAGEKTEDSFAALANEKSTDPGSNTNGGLYTQITKGQMMPEFENWCFDASRKEGDTGLVRTTYGYHVMYFVGSQPSWIQYVESDMMTERSNSFVSEAVAKYPLTVDYSAILLALSGLGAQ